MVLGFGVYGLCSEVFVAEIVVSLPCFRESRLL